MLEKDWRKVTSKGIWGVEEEPPPQNRAVGFVFAFVAIVCG